MARAYLLTGVLAIVALCCGHSSRERIKATVLSGLERIGPESEAYGSSEATIWAARGEFEPFQVAVFAGDGDLTGVNVSLAGLPVECRIYREHYVRVTESSQDLGGTNRPMAAGWYPDALIPLWKVADSSFSVAAGRNQAVWLDLYVPREAIAGTYTGTVEVTSDQGNVSLPVTLRVWDFQLPIKPSMKSSFNIDKPLTEDAGTQEELIRHRIMPFVVTDGIERERVNTTGLWFWSGANGKTCLLPPAPSVATFQDAVTKAGGSQPGVPLYVYSADEITRCQGMLPELRRWAQNIHAAGAANLLTAIPVAELRDDGSGTGRGVADIWALLPKQFDSNGADVAAARRQGGEIWSYNALVQDSYSPKWLVDFAPVNLRIQPGFLSQSLGLTGILYWSVNAWGADPWHDIQYKEGGHSFPGEGILVYPGAPAGVAGVVPSMRLKWLREGMEDYEYVEILKRLGRGDWALEVARSVGADWKNWSHDREVLEKARIKLGNEIERLTGLRQRRP